MFQAGGELGQVLASAAGDGACQDLTQRARGIVGDLKVEVGRRSDVATAFEEPFRIQEERRARAAEAQQKKAHAAQPLKDRITQAGEQAAMSKVMEAFLHLLQKQDPPKK